MVYNVYVYAEKSASVIALALFELAYEINVKGELDV